MHPRYVFPPALTRLLPAQEFVVGREQALALGMPRRVLERMTESGAWSALGPGVYYTLAQEPPWRSRAWAGVLLGGDAACLTLHTAGPLYGLVPDAPAEIEVLVPHLETPVSRSGYRMIRTRNAPRVTGNPPMTSPERTVIDLCAAHRWQVSHYLTQAITRRLTTPDNLLIELATRKRCAGRHTIKAILIDARDGMHSELEREYRHEVEYAHGLPRGRRQTRAGSFCRDVAYDFGLVVELDGRAGHDGADIFRDMDRDNFHTRRGEATLRYGWPQVHGDPCRAAAEIYEVARRLGYQGPFTRCPRCWRINGYDFSP